MRDALRLSHTILGCLGPFFHEFEQWRDIEAGTTHRHIDVTEDVTLPDHERWIETGRFILQRRDCQACGYTQLRKVRS